MVLFKRGSNADIIKDASAAVGDDEEKRTADANPETAVSRTEKARNESETDEALVNQPKMTDVFSWQHVKYTVSIGDGERRQLLDDVSGYVAPGKLTALMGESGAGKVSLNFLFTQIIKSNRAT